MGRRIAIAALSLVLASCAAAPSKHPEAQVYRTITESEWGMELSLIPDGTAKLEIASWMPGESENPTIEKYSGSWAKVGSTIELRVVEGFVHFAYSPHLSLKDAGRTESLPGLVGTNATFKPHLFKGREFWVGSEIDKLNWEVTD